MQNDYLWQSDYPLLVFGKQNANIALDYVFGEAFLMIELCKDEWSTIGIAQLTSTCKCLEDKKCNMS